jgi:hypothetical protein
MALSPKRVMATNCLLVAPRSRTNDSRRGQQSEVYQTYPRLGRTAQFDPIRTSRGVQIVRTTGVLEGRALFETA